MDEFDIHRLEKLALHSTRYGSTPEQIEAAAKGELVQIQDLRRSPHITRTIDNTALSAYMACPRRFYYSMVLHRRGRGKLHPALTYGKAWHAGLEAHYKTGGNVAAVERAIIMAWDPHDKPDDHRTPERCISSYHGYLKHWGSHSEDCSRFGFTVGYPDNALVEIPVEIGGEGLLHPYAGRIDRIIELQGLYYVEDHKTSSRMGTYWAADWDPSSQMLGYVWLAQKLSGLPIAGVRINMHAVLKTQDKFDRAIISYSKDRINEWGANYNHWVLSLEEAYENSAVNLPANSSEFNPEWLGEKSFPMNQSACFAKYGACGYVGVCTSPPTLRDRILEADYEVKPWDPMNPDAEVEVIGTGGDDA